MERAVREACIIAGVTPIPQNEEELSKELKNSSNQVVILDSAECLARAYARKLSALKGTEASQLEGRLVLLVEMGHIHTTIVIVRPNSDLQSVKIERVLHSSHVGSFQFDCAIYENLKNSIEQKHHCNIEKATKKGMRLMRACERLRKLLSQLPTSSITVENISDSGDANVNMTREDMARICSEPLNKFSELLNSAIEGFKDDISAIEIVGGGVRMAMVQELILSVVGKDLPLGAKLDDGSIAVGAAILANEKNDKSLEDIIKAVSIIENNSENNEIDSEKILPPIPPTTNLTESSQQVATVGLTFENIIAARQAEVFMQEKDKEIRELLASRNELEGYILEMKGVPNRKHGQKVDRNALLSALETKENWLWDNGEIATLQELKHEFAQLKEQIEGQYEVESSNEGNDGENNAPTKRRRVGGICSEYLNAIEADRIQLEETLAVEAALAAEQRAADGEDEDHDFRKLKKADRMRLVVKNKDEGTELFKGGNIRPAAARYQKALSHAAKFFDLSPEDTEEVNQVKLSIHLNLAQCYLKMENWDFAIKYAGEALAISPTSAKAYFRRSAAYEAKKEYEKSLEDLKQAANNTPTEDKAITKGIERIKKLIQKEKDKEKKMWGKAFSS